MSFIRAKEIPPHSGNWYDYEVMTVHENGHVRQKVLRYIGKSSRGSGGSVVPHTLSLPAISNPGKVAIPRVTCKHCQGENTRKYGVYKGAQNYYCNDCHTKFTGTDALAHGRVSPSHIASALNEFYSGMSLHAIEHNIDQLTDDDISHTAVMKWVNKFSKEAIKHTKDLQPKVGNTWVADETYVRVDKNRFNVENPYSRSIKAKWVIFWDIIDADTRFLLASHCTSTRSKKDAQALIQKAVDRAGKTPKEIVTDNLRAYLDGIELVCGSETKHKQSDPFTIGNDNNLIERFHGTLKDRTKVMRALKNRDTLERFSDGWLVHYNFFRPNTAIGNRPPAEEAGLKYDYHNWADVVGYEKEPIVKTLEPKVESA